jgi:hypothetical protein
VSEFMVKSRGLYERVEADSHEEAARKAFAAAKVGTEVGTFCSTKRKGEPTMWHLSEWYMTMGEAQIEPEEVELHAICCPCERCSEFRAMREREKRLERLEDAESAECA